jgi:hypothetical protein
MNSEGYTVVIAQIFLFWGLILCNLVAGYWRIGGTCYLYLQCRSFIQYAYFESMLLFLHWCLYIVYSLCGLIRRPEHLIAGHWYLPANWSLLILWSPDQLVSQCYVIECDRRFYCALFCVFTPRVSQCPISLRAEHSIFVYSFVVFNSVVDNSDYIALNGNRIQI